MRHNIVTEYVKKNGGAFSTFKNSQPKHSYALANGTKRPEKNGYYCFRS